MRFRYNAENPLGYRIVEQNLIDQVAGIPAPDLSNIRDHDAFAAVLSPRHLDGEEQAQNIRIEVKNHRMFAT